MKRIPGHALRGEGKAFLVNEFGEIVPAHYGQLGTGGYGRAYCECGALSPLLDSANQRKTWHRDHKGDVLGGTWTS